MNPTQLQNAGKATAGCGCTFMLLIIVGIVLVVSILAVIGALV